jgi:hypothetical protein
MRHRRHAVRLNSSGNSRIIILRFFQHVAHAAGHAQVVFQHVVLALALALGARTMSMPAMCE